MNSKDFEPQYYSHIIRAEPGVSLQSQIDQALLQGYTHLKLEGRFAPVFDAQFSLLTIKTDKPVVIEESNAVFDGEGKVAHLLYVGDGCSIKISNIHFTNGDTTNKNALVSVVNFPGDRINIFRYIDRGAISMGIGSDVELDGCKFTNNKSAVCGGAISVLGGALKVNNCIFKKNSCGDTGAAIDVLSPGSLAIDSNSKFAGNQANLLGQGNHGVISAFPDTFLAVADCDFSEESGTGIDYTNSTQANFQRINPEDYSLVVNPIRNRGIRQQILSHVAFIMMQKYGRGIKLERIPAVESDIFEKHQKMFDEACKAFRRSKLPL